MKLEKLGIELPYLPTTSVGSLPKPDYLRMARRDYRKGKISKQELLEKEKEATIFWVKKQEDIGIDVLVDGEMYRGDMVTYFAENMVGFAESGLVRSYGNRYYRRPIIKDRIRWEKPISTEWWEFAQSLTKKPIKGMVTGPYTILDWSFNEYYPTRKDAVLALAKELRKEIEDLVKKGAKIIQIDEPALSVRSEELPLVIDSMHILTEGISAYFITHICFGELGSIYPGVLELPVNNLDLEASGRIDEILGLFRKDPPTKDISFGILDVHSHQIEPHVVVIEKLKTVLDAIPPERLWIDPDCGLKTRTPEEAIEKLQVMVKTTKLLRSGLNSPSTQP